MRVHLVTNERRPLSASGPTSPPLLFPALAVWLVCTPVAGQSPSASQGPSEQAFRSGRLLPVIRPASPFVIESLGGPLPVYSRSLVNYSNFLLIIKFFY